MNAPSHTRSPWLMVAFLAVACAPGGGCEGDKDAPAPPFRTGGIRSLPVEAPPTPPLAVALRLPSGPVRIRTGEPIDCLVAVNVPEGGVLPTVVYARLWSKRRGLEIEGLSARAVPKEREPDGICTYIFAGQIGEWEPIRPARYQLVAEAILSEARISKSGPPQGIVTDHRYRSRPVPVEVRR